MNPFTVVVTIIIFAILLIYKSVHRMYVALFSFAAVLEMNNLVGFFIQIGGKEIEYADVALFAASLVAIIYLQKNSKIKTNQFVTSLLMVASIGFGIVHTLVSIPDTKVLDYNTPWDGYLSGRVELSNAVITVQTALMLLRVLLFLLNSYVVYQLDRDDLFDIAGVCKKFTKLHIGYALIEAATKYVMQSNIMTELRDFFFGSGRAAHSAFQVRGTGNAIYGWTNEASLVPEVMFLFIVLCVLTRDMKKQKLWVVLAAFIMVLSMSFSTVMYIACLAILFLFVYADKLNRKTIMLFAGGIAAFVGICCVLFRNEYYVTRLNGFFQDASLILGGKVKFSADDVTSAKVRLLGIAETMKGFYERPLFGLGLGTAYCNSGLASILSNLGLVGLGLWLYYCLRYGARSGELRKYLVVFSIILLLPNIFTGMMGMLYATHNLLIIQLIKTSFDNKGLEEIQAVKGYR